MGSILNGLALSKIRAYGSGFMIFSDYMRAPIRLAAIMEIPTIFIFTHDSIGVGEDGPTHQPIEQLASLRAIPRLITLRPGDANEVVEAWKVIMRIKHEPVALILRARPCRLTIARSSARPRAWPRAPTSWPTRRRQARRVAARYRQRGGALRRGVGGAAMDGIKARVVSMPSWELFDHQSQDYRDGVLPPAVTARVSVEQASTFGWHRYVGMTGEAIGMKTFGASAPLKELQKKFGFSVDAVVAAAKKQLASRR